MGDPNTGEIYSGTLREAEHVALSETQADRLRQLQPEQRIDELQEMVRQREQAKPDLRTLDGAMSYLDSHAPNDDTLPRHQNINAAFQTLIAHVWPYIPDGPGKTVAVRAIGRARMECNSAIANGGQ